MYQTIRKNSLKTIREILGKAILIKGHVYDDTTGGDSKRFTIDEVMAKASRFRRVNLETDTGTLVISLGGNDNFYAFPNVDAAKKSLTPMAFAKYFPAEGAAPLRKTIEREIEHAKRRQANPIDEIAAAREAALIERLSELAGVIRATEDELEALHQAKRVDARGCIAANDD